MDDYALLLTSLYKVHFRVGDGDCIRWRLTRDGIFSINTYFRSLLRPVESSLCKLPPNVAFLLWTVVREQGLMVDNLRARVFML